MKNKFAKKLFLSLGLLGVFSPTVFSWAEQPSDPAKIRVASFLYHPNETSIVFSDITVVRGIICGEMTPFGDYSPGHYKLLAVEPESGLKIASGMLEIPKNVPTTLVLIGDPSGKTNFSPHLKVFLPGLVEIDKQSDIQEPENVFSITILNADPYSNAEVNYLGADGLQTAVVSPGNEIHLDTIPTDRPGLSIKLASLDDINKPTKISLPIKDLIADKHYLCILFRPYGTGISPEFSILDLTEGGFVGTEEREAEPKGSVP
jgi:hypothetical protein